MTQRKSHDKTTQEVCAWCLIVVKPFRRWIKVGEIGTLCSSCHQEWMDHLQLPDYVPPYVVVRRKAAAAKEMRIHDEHEPKKTA